MSKEEFIQWLEKKDKKSSIRLFAKEYCNSNDYWRYYQPQIDGLGAEINLKTEGKVILISYNGLFDNSPDKIEYTYEDFIYCHETAR